MALIAELTLTPPLPIEIEHIKSKTGVASSLENSQMCIN